MAPPAAGMAEAGGLQEKLLDTAAGRQSTATGLAMDADSAALQLRLGGGPSSSRPRVSFAVAYVGCVDGAHGAATGQGGASQPVPRQPQCVRWAFKGPLPVLHVTWRDGGMAGLRARSWLVHTQGRQPCA